MKLSYIIVAETVELYAGGKFAIIGTFDLVKAPELPFTFRPFGVAIKVQAEKGEQGRSYKATVSLRKARSRKSILEFPWEFQFPKVQPGTPSASQLALHLSALPFASAGKYIIELRVSSRSLGKVELGVQREKRPSDRKRQRKGTRDR